MISIRPMFTSRLDEVIRDMDPVSRLPGSSLCRTGRIRWLNVKRSQVVSSLALAGHAWNNERHVDAAKQLLLATLKHQRADGFFTTDHPPRKNDPDKANVAMLMIELFNAYELLRTRMTAAEVRTFRQSAERSASYLLRNIPLSAEINQLFAVALVLAFCNKHFGLHTGDAERYIDIIRTLQRTEGYWCEKNQAPGFDALYGSLQLAYLARYVDVTGDRVAATMLAKATRFVKGLIMANGDMDISCSKRWLPPCPQGKRFFIYPLFRFYSRTCANYIEKAIKNCDTTDIYYILRGMQHKRTDLLGIIRPKATSPEGTCVLQKGKLRLAFAFGPTRISGGMLASLYHKQHAWIVQQGIIMKDDLSSHATQLRVELDDGRILSSAYDSHAYFDPVHLKTIGVLRVEDKKHSTSPFSHYQVEDAVSDVLYTRSIRVLKDRLEVNDTLVFGKDMAVRSVKALTPCVHGRVEAPVCTSHAIPGIYGLTTLFEASYIGKKQMRQGDVLTGRHELWW